MDVNIELTKEQCDFIRSLNDFDLMMFLSEINEHGWKDGKELLKGIQDSIKAGNNQTAPPVVLIGRN